MTAYSVLHVTKQALIAVPYLINNVDADPCCYVHCVETHRLKTGAMFQLFFCMLPIMSLWLMHVTYCLIECHLKKSVENEKSSKLKLGTINI
jgi:hypothetical protein